MCSAWQKKARLTEQTIAEQTARRTKKRMPACLCLAGGTIAYKYKFQLTVTGSSKEAEFMAACDTGKKILFVRRNPQILEYHKKPLL
jgi:hypothetical protein